MYELIHAERANIPRARACRVLDVSRSGYYKWLHGEPSSRSTDDAVLAVEVKQVFNEQRFISRSGGQEFFRVRLDLSLTDRDQFNFEKSRGERVTVRLLNEDTLLATQLGKRPAEFRRI